MRVSQQQKWRENYTRDGDVETQIINKDILNNRGDIRAGSFNSNKKNRRLKGVGLGRWWDHGGEDLDQVY